MMIVLGCSSCKPSGEGADPEACLRSVKKMFPNSKIYSKYNSIRWFYVIDSTGVKIVYTGNKTDSKITDVEFLFQR